MSELIQPQQKKFQILKAQVARLSSEVERRRLIIQIRDFKLQCLIDAVRAVNDGNNEKARLLGAMDKDLATLKARAKI